VHLVAAEQHRLAEVFGGETADEVDKLAQWPWREGPEGVPILEGVRNVFVGRVLARFELGDHVGHLLEPMAARHEGDVESLGFQEARDIEAGAGRVAAEISGDVAASAARLEETWTACLEAGWPHRDLRAGDEYPTTSIPVRRLREVEMHHLDLGLRYRIADWPPEYVAWELPQILATVPGRVKELSDARSLVAWLSGRGPVPTAIGLEDW